MRKGFVLPLILIVIIASVIAIAIVIYFQFKAEKPPQIQNITQNTPELRCLNITSELQFNNCIGRQVKVIGELRCMQGESPKARVHEVVFDDMTDLAVFEQIPNCEQYDHKQVAIQGELHQCKELDQCAGIGLVKIDSIAKTLKGVEETKLTAVARSYLKTKPDVFLSDKNITWDQAQVKVEELDLNYLLTNEPDWMYFEDGENYKSAQQYLNKFVVRWSPGCKQIERSSDTTKFIEPSCIPFYELNVLINTDLVATSADLNSLDNVQW